MTTETAWQLTETRRVGWAAGDEAEPPLEARLVMRQDGFLELWNGWVCPAFDRANTERIVAGNNELMSDAGNAGMEVETFEWDGDTLLSYYGGDRGQVERIEPFVDDAGVKRWLVGAWSWTWMEIGEDE